MSRSTFKIPILPHLKKYVAKKFFADLHEPYKITENTLLGKLFMSVIIDGRKVDFIDKHLEQKETLSVKLSQDMLHRSPRLHKLIAINFFLDKLFKEEMISWILSAEYLGVRPFPASKNFLQFYDIEESEYSHDAAYRHWQRWKSAPVKKSRQLRHKKPSVVSH